MSGIREYMDIIERAGELARVRREVSAKYEIAGVTARSDGGDALLFENVSGSGYRIVSNLVGTRGRFARALGTGPRSIHQRMLDCIRDSREPEAVPRGAFLENSGSSARDLPIVTHFEKESGPFIASAVVFAVNPDTGKQNASFHRMMPLDGRRFTIRMVEGRHLHRCYMNAAEHGQDLEVAVVVGVHPAVLIAGAYQAQWGSDEMWIANRILGRGLKMAPVPGCGIRVPAEAEVVMAGKILHDSAEREWMVEMLQTYDYERRQPVFRLDSIHHRNEPVFHDILSGYGEHRLLMGMPVESKINGALRHVPGFASASLTRGGCNWLHAVVRIKKRRDTDPRQIIREAFGAHRSLKQVIVVDQDIDPEDAVQVEYAMATRFQADRDIEIVRDTRGSSLDPSSDQKNLRTAKMGIDATIPLDKRPEGFEVARIPGMDGIVLSEYVSIASRDPPDVHVRELPPQEHGGQPPAHAGARPGSVR